jgi:hypothetical protein
VEPLRENVASMETLLRAAVGAGVREALRRPLTIYLGPSPATLRPKEAGEVGRNAGGGDRPFTPAAGQVLQGIR